ncbi:MAG TPA: hypothetical protein VLX44_14215 [Xanthobacteraceae bacterium]|nr:hypothetical protein [Xanthobacteraceae bacterium]
MQETPTRTTGTDPSRPTELDTTRARQAVTGHNVRYVLVLGTIGVVIGFVIVYWVVRASFGA